MPWPLIAADYAALYAARSDSRERLLARAPVRFLTNPSLHAVVMIRVALGGPAILMGMWRRILLAKHSIELEAGFELGPGVVMPHPFGLVLGSGAKVGANVVLYHNVTVGRPEGDERAPAVLGDRVTVYTNTIIRPGAVVGARATIGANSLVEGEVPPGSLLKRGGVVRRCERAEPPTGAEA